MPKHVPERTCIVTRVSGPAAELMRFVLGPDGQVVPDLRGKLPGRGAWVTPTRDAVGQAVRKRLFPRAFKAAATVSADLAAEVEAGLRREVLGALGLANKAGGVTTGFTKVEGALRAGAAAALIHAREAAEDGRRKLAGALRSRSGDTISAISTYDDFASHELDMALGRVGVIHAALLAGDGSEGCLARWRRLRRYIGVVDAGAFLQDDAISQGPAAPAVIRIEAAEKLHERYEEPN